MSPDRQMTTAELSAAVGSELSSALGKTGDRWSESRFHAYEYYMGNPRGDEQMGRSQVVSHDIADIVEGLLPSLMKIFASSDKVVEFNARGPEDVEAAEQATDYLNFVFSVRNDGFRVLYDFAKDGLLARLGVGKAWWDRMQKVTVHTYVGLTEDEYIQLLTDQELEPIEHSEYASQVQDPATGQPAEIPVHDLKVRRVKKWGCLRVASVPPEEFRVDAQATDLKEGFRFLCHLTKKTQGELLALGYPEDAVKGGAAATDEIDSSQERLARVRHNTVSYTDAGGGKDANSSVWVTEAYYRVDFDGDDWPELRRIVMLGHEIVENEEVAGHPFFTWCPIPVPHTVVGLSVYDTHKDIQDVKTVLVRNGLDNVYTTNQPSFVGVKGQFDPEDAMSRECGRIIRVTQRGAFEQLNTTPQLGPILQMIEYVDTVRDNRGPQTRMNQGMDPNSINKTATGVSALMNAAQLRVDLIARHLAEGVVECFRKMLALTVEYQTEPDIMRLRNKFVSVDPRSWNSEMDVSIAVGLGTGSKDQTLAHLLTLLQTQTQIVQVQGGVDGPLVTAQNVYNLLAEVVKNMGQGTVKALFTDPSTLPPPDPQGPSPEEQQAQAEMQLKAEDLKIKQQKADQNMELNSARIRQKAEADSLKSGMEAGRMQMDSVRMGMEAQRDMMDRSGGSDE